ncbi:MULTISPECIES: hypothetical protein [unclassified Variovorax]|uniref:hypothetical protein n=1 Tax=unclassified Variovorax TaxID=663243 RepID=UPI00076CF15B|nr:MULTISPECIES: hypothetical protein [unclassified Variovorax]KWT98647.1 hypothetical protein APY03_0230 [Variovorax sp. WDL1]PNG59374.1 hypothetical protein CHC07_01101 [Variovorax sp. B4]PNG60835.1 hypothetical protein CHC06_00734 [Variovorax sp. B2]VTV13245.1 hypothetical protein WDL1CHR_03930 [Variovorax sp. WDL1]
MSQAKWDRSTIGVGPDVNRRRMFASVAAVLAAGFIGGAVVLRAEDGAQRQDGACPNGSRLPEARPGQSVLRSVT